MAVREQPGPSADEARAFLAAADFIWHQRFQLVEGVHTPGASDIEWLLGAVQLPEDLTNRTVLDIGTSNGGAAFIAEHRGARRVVAVDIYPGDRFGILALKEFLGSRIEFVQASVYELPGVLDGQFDVVLFLGVLYHLRHPLLALDAVRSLTRGEALLETAVADHELGELRSYPLARFYPRDELGGDPSNWFAPSVAALLAWCSSSGLDPELLGAWPPDAPQRCALRALPSRDDPEYVRVSYERPLRVDAQPDQPRISREESRRSNSRQQTLGAE
jgi:tRNA (mo5U34)-methyltransferase